MSYEVHGHLRPKSLEGISAEQIAQHWKLYEGSVKNANGLLEAIAKAPAGSPSWAELKQRMGFEIDGIALHEYYFGNLASGATLSSGGDLAADLASGTPFNWWVSSHEHGHPAGFHPLLVLEVYEHAFMVDYGASGREEYIAAFLKNVNWDVVEQRYKNSRARLFAARF